MSIARSNLDQDFTPEENEQEQEARTRLPSGRAVRWAKRALIGIPTAIVALIVLVNGANIAVELLWFGSLGLPDVFLTILKTRLLLFFGAAGLFFAAFFFSTTIAYRLAQRRWAAWGDAGDVATAGRRTPPALVLVAILALGGLLALWLGATLSGQWDPALRLPHRTDMGIADLLGELEDKVGPHHYDRLDLHFDESLRATIMARLQSAAPSTIAGLPVEQVDTQDGFRYLLEGGYWALIRFSGTEPLLRIYAEAESPDDVRVMLEEARGIAGV